MMHLHIGFHIFIITKGQIQYRQIRGRMAGNNVAARTIIRTTILIKNVAYATPGNAL